MMKEFVPYNEALELRKLEFDEPCFGYYDNTGKLFFNTNGQPVGKDWVWEGNQIVPTDMVLAPTHSQAFRFFREKYNLHSEILLDQTSQPKYCFEIHKYEDFGNYEEIRIGEWFLYRTPEEAELECIKHLIKVVEGY